MGKDMKRHFTEKNMRMVNKHMKMYWMSLSIRELQTKATGRYHYKPVRAAK